MKISIKGITKEYRNRNACVKALDSIDLEFDGSELVLITGENGCGKSTLLNIIGGLDSPTSGTISADGSRDNAGLKERAENRALRTGTRRRIHDSRREFPVLRHLRQRDKSRRSRRSRTSGSYNKTHTAGYLRRVERRLHAALQGRQISCDNRHIHGNS